MLKEKHKQFCREYLKDFNIAAAMIRVGYSSKHAHKNGYLMVKHPEVAAYLKKLLEKVTPPELTATRVLEEMRRLAFADIRDYYKWSELKKRYVLKALDELTHDQSACIARYVPGEGYFLHDKQNALGMLGKHFKLFTELNETLHSFTMMGTITLDGDPLIFEVGKPKKSTS